ncbi:hypothetical protein GSI_07324 [Ganoderma sinense ZZ0214-1]|uniref:Uncharacterized protein n=1 Tax=Ganoderma sinense ZZ0214-1 TaxID=1077348 RepID=A0A2G8SA37_9APHY|nr:hypothetical protein GSI_07324 [Ganoderma sinense ZZ0214-1]
MMHIALYVNGGVDHNLAAPHAMVYYLESLADESEHNQDPSQAFGILNAKIIHKDDLFFLASLWEDDSVADRQRVLACWRESVTDPDLVGAFPVMFIVQGSGGVSSTCYKAYRPLRHPVDASPEPALRLAFDDLNVLCWRAINLGIVFERPKDTTQIYPEAGVYSLVGRSRKGWKKTSTPDIWEGFLAPMMKRHPDEFLSGLHLEMIWALFENW